MASYIASMQYTIGTALTRAQEAGHDVEVLVGGQWLVGTVVANDGVGVVLESSETEHAVVRMDSINAVRVYAATPHRRRLHAAAGMDAHRHDASTAMPMPGPRVPSS